MAQDYIFATGNEAVTPLNELSYFDFFKVPRRFDIDVNEVEQIYSEYRKALVDDNFANAPDSVKRKAEQLNKFLTSAYVNLSNDFLWISLQPWSNSLWFRER